MPIEDYLLPNENIRFQSDGDIAYGTKKYEVILTDKRLILFARRGLIFKNDDVISDTISEIQGIKYKERGRLFKKSFIEIYGRSKIRLEGEKKSMLTLYQRLLPFLSPELRVGIRSQSPYAQPIQSLASERITSPISKAPKFCEDCGTEILLTKRFCPNCGRSLIGVTP